MNIPRALAPVNAVLTPLIKAGLGAPLPLGSGFVVLEIPGRKTGIVRELPLTGIDLGSRLVVATVRSRSQWIRNLAAASEIDVWLRGRRRRAAVRMAPSGRCLQRAVLDLSG